jgi:two-component system phosphate regulon response regulator PhoB
VKTDLGTIVVVEDDANIADLVDIYLRREGFRVIQAVDGEAGLGAIERERPRLAILDVGLPGTVDGLEVCRRIRARAPLPVLMLTARDGEIDRVLGLELGADDYVTKPFSPRELQARIKSVLRRRAPEAAQEMLAIGGLQLDPVAHRVTAAGATVDLGPTEFRLLKFLMARPDRVHTRTQLLDQVWGDHVYIEERTIDVHIRRLRLALEPHGQEHMIETVRGTGYRLAAAKRQ